MIPISGVLILLFEFIGLSITLYLIIKNIRHQSPTCFIGQDCSVVLNSKYSKILGIKVEVYGFLYYVSMLVLFMAKYFFDDFAQIIIMVFIIATGLSVVSSVILTYIQTRVIKSLCSWCLLATTNNIALFFTMLYYINKS